MDGSTVVLSVVSKRSSRTLDNNAVSAMSTVTVRAVLSITVSPICPDTSKAVIFPNRLG